MRLPAPFPDELLLGRLIRHITVTREEAGALTKKMFGSSRASIHPFLTSGLADLAEFIREDAGVLICRQTLAPLFFFYLPNHAERLKMFLLANDGAKAIRESQLPSFASGHSLCLKWCPLCAQNDLHECGVTYWHRAHQIPGVTACYKHPVLLQRVALERRQRLITGLLPSCNACQRPASGIEHRVAEFSESLLSQLEVAIPSQELASIYRHRLNELGYLSSGRRLRRQSLLRHFAVEVEQYRASTDVPLLRDRGDYRYLSELLEPNGSHHPFRHLLFGTWLFNAADNLLGCKPLPLGPVTGPTEWHTAEKWVLEQRCLKLLRQGHSMADVYRLTGKSRCYLKRLAIQHGVLLNLKPRVLTSELQQRIIRMARAGVHREAISKRCGIGVGSVEQVISSEPGLVEWRKKCHLESKRRSCRVRIVRYRQCHPDVIRQVIKEECNAEFFWLYGNDREWLQQALPPPRRATGRAR